MIDLMPEADSFVVTADCGDEQTQQRALAVLEDWDAQHEHALRVWQGLGPAGYNLHIELAKDATAEQLEALKVALEGVVLGDVLVKRYVE